ncbi:TPA: hypothetical protein ACYKUE_006090 [Pseudomonas aeruginosa]
MIADTSFIQACDEYLQALDDISIALANLELTESQRQGIISASHDLTDSFLSILKDLTA